MGLAGFCSLLLSRILAGFREKRGLQELPVKGTAYIVAALGNPGREYERSRHNMGFLLADYAAERAPGNARWKAWRGVGRCFETELGGKRVFLLKPETYMNNSGLAVQSLAGYYKVPLSGVLAVYDDMDLPFGTIKLRRGGTAGGHKGMASIIAALGSSKIARLKIGIGRAPGADAKDYVLDKFSAAEEKVLGATMERAYAALTAVFEKNLEAAMNLYNTKSSAGGEAH